jgi:hypothetical protein
MHGRGVAHLGGPSVTTDPAPRGRRGQSHARIWWIAGLFMIGSSLFGLGAVPYYSEAVGLRIGALTFFVGSLFFTSAAFLVYREAVDALPAPAGSRRQTVWVWAPRNLGWLG